MENQKKIEISRVKKGRLRNAMYITIATVIMLPIFGLSIKKLMTGDADGLTILMLSILDLAMVIFLINILQRRFEREVGQLNEIDKLMKATARQGFEVGEMYANRMNKNRPEGEPIKFRLEEQDFARLVAGMEIDKKGVKVILADIGTANMIDLVLEGNGK